MGVFDLGARRVVPEVMDDPGLDAGLHRQALGGLARIHRWSGSLRLLWRPIQALAAGLPDRPLRVLDVATGGGDLPIRLWQRARRRGLSLEAAGCDQSPQAVQSASEQAERVGASVRFFVHDALGDDIPPEYQVIMSSLFLHHLQTEQAVQLLSRMKKASPRLLVIHDLERSRAGLMLAWAGTRLLSRSPVVHADGVRSVRAAYTQDELRGLAATAGLSGARVERAWPCRLLLTWTREP